MTNTPIPMKYVILEKLRHMFHRLEAKIFSMHLTLRNSEIIFVREKQQILFQTSVSSDITQHLCLTQTQNKQMNDIYHQQVTYCFVLSHLTHNIYLLTN